MDISAIATQDKADEGIWAEVALYGKKQGFELKIRGADSNPVVRYDREKAKRLKDIALATLRNRDNYDDEEKKESDTDEIIDSSDEDVIIRICGIRGKKGEDDHVILLGKTLDNDEASYRFLIEKVPAVKDFVLRFSNRRENFLEGRKKN